MDGMVLCCTSISPEKRVSVKPLRLGLLQQNPLNESDTDLPPSHRRPTWPLWLRKWAPSINWT